MRRRLPRRRHRRHLRRRHRRRLRPPPPANRPPVVRAACDPCTVEVGQDGDGLGRRAGSGRRPADLPLDGGRRHARERDEPPDAVDRAACSRAPCTFTVTVNDGKGGTASANDRRSQVVAPPREGVHVRGRALRLRPLHAAADALQVLDEAVDGACRRTRRCGSQIEGHTCNIGTAEYNLALGERRANAVRDYLISRGITADRLQTVSYGEERPKYDNTREETRRLNRRAALVVRLQ